MDTFELRQSVLDFIEHQAYDKFLRLVRAMANTYQQEGSGERDSLEKYNAEIDQAISEIESGDFYTQEEVRKMAQGW